jgi:ribonuclease D
LCWDWQDGADDSAAVDAFLRDGAARAWQRALVVPVLAPAMRPSAPA